MAERFALLFYAGLSCGIAAVEWALNPEFLVQWFPRYASVPQPILEFAWFAVMILLAVCWLGVVVMGILKCGWPGLILLVPVPWGLRIFLSFGALSAFCHFGHDCP
ncbi:MAG: hypothetical protein ACLQDM_19960 [Bradyrhizobium sp.]